MSIVTILLTTLISISGFAQGMDPVEPTSTLTCVTTGESLGRPTHVTVTVNLQEEVSEEALPGGLSAVGQGFLFIDGSIRMVEANEGQVVLELKSKLHEGQTEEQQTVILMSFSATMAEEGYQLTGAGHAEIVNQGTQWQLRSSEYSLSECKGLLK